MSGRPTPDRPPRRPKLPKGPLRPIEREYEIPPRPLLWPLPWPKAKDK
jgi:hypothetical protein